MEDPTFHRGAGRWVSFARPKGRVQGAITAIPSHPAPVGGTPPMPLMEVHCLWRRNRRHMRDARITQ